MNFNHSDKFFYSENIIESHILLCREESVHCIKVLRLTIGDQLMVTDGRGQIANCILIDTNTKSCKLEIISKKYIQHNIGNKIHIAISPTKNINRFEWFLEKTVELGIREITPILTQRSERDKLNVDRIHKKMITALKQSNNAFLPLLNPLVKFDDFIKQRNDVQKFICHNENNSIPYLKDVIATDKNYILLIGPEGGFTSTEVKHAEDYHYQQTLLGDSRYRTETAGILACHTIHLCAK